MSLRPWFPLVSWSSWAWLALLASSLLRPLQAEEGGEVTGQVLFEGEIPRPKRIRMNADKECDKMHGETKVYFDNLVVSEGRGIRWVFVYLHGVKGEYPTPADPVQMLQKGCGFSPHVSGVRVGQKLEILNEDPVPHNINCTAKFNKPFNETQSSGNRKEQVFTNAEVMVGFRCDLHPWMGAYCGVTKHPFFAVTDEKGQFTIRNVPPGSYTLKAWHEELGSQGAPVTVTAGASQAVTLTFKGGQ
ncbi:MAG: carboxypeptidase regulatory-like domain-containing protein [Planctomycetes bacterium]|nr:carboxypeptidase regulatory-like domain-containing protein [Planctomycetota bacterium]